MKKILNIGLDVGSTTVKSVVLDNDKIIFSSYERHYSDTLRTITKILTNIINMYKGNSFTISMTGSGAIELANFLGVSFVQEVIACKNAINKYNSTCDVAIELGGEDAKIIYFGTTVEQRMNSSCAGGTGAFLDQMAVLLNTDTIGLNELAKLGTTIYPIASRCGVFAKTDIQPLLNEGAKKEDIALSIMQAVVNQTISGLACGKPIRGNVIFLGGPLNYLSVLKSRFIETLNLNDSQVLKTDDARIFVCLGAILEDDNKNVYSFKEVEELIEKSKSFKETSSGHVKYLFKNKKEYDAFKKRHAKDKVKRGDLSKYKGDLFVGIDAGSTTAKVVAISKTGRLLYENYQGNKGTPVDTVKEMLLDFYSKKNPEAVIRYAGSTGYGEGLIKAAFSLDTSEIETMAHYEAAEYFLPGVNSIIDIGGQDMKYIKIKNNAVESIMLNEACSSGCGSFIETLAKSLNITVSDFVDYAITSKNPIDLGSRCTVFMNSKIKQAQKEGALLSDIFAGLSYSVIKNALQKVMKIRNFDSLGDKIVVQGGTFLNDAILKAFENLTGKKVIRPDIAGLMGAYGVALIALNEYKELGVITESLMLSKEDIEKLNIKTTHTRCQGCENHCSLTINTFNKKSFISGNRCERGSGNNGSFNTLPNLVAWKYSRVFDYKSNTESKLGKIGIPRVLNMYENYPLWHTLLTSLGFEVVLSDHSNRKIYELGIESMPSESVCYPAKLVHGHIINLINKGIDKIFYPCIMYENIENKTADNHFNCPIVQSYPEAIKLNVDEINNIKFANPFLPLDEKNLTLKLLEIDFFKEYKFSKSQMRKAVKAGLLELEKYRKDVQLKGEETLEYIIKNKLKAICLAGRPYHIDKEVNHGIDTMINSLGLVVLTEDSICHLSKIESKLRAVDQWAYHSRVYKACDVVSRYKNIELVELNSFGCGLDAIITDQAEEILKANNKLYTTIKIDEINNLGAAKIRIRSLIASMNRKDNKRLKYKPYEYKKNYFKETDRNHTLLFPDMSTNHMPLIESIFKSIGYNAVYLTDTSDETVETGLKNVNNDACYPAIIVIGQLIHALQSGKYDLDNTSVMISQTGGGCRATNYIGLIRKALKEAGLEKVSVLSINASGLEKEQAFKINVPTALRVLQGVVYGDLLMKLLYATRPYEKNKGETKQVYDKHMSIAIDAIENRKSKDFKKNIRNIINDFKNIEIKNTKKTKVGIVGEILIKYHTFGNDNLVEKLEAEGCEVTVPELMGFFKYCCYNGIVKSNERLDKKSKKYIYKFVLKIMDYYEKEVKKELKNTRFRDTSNIYHLADNVENILSKANQTGEGWFLTAEMIELIKDGIDNVICVQPFACLPNHIVGKSVIKRIKELYPDANIIAIDYDPGASHTNQVNRIKLMLSSRKK